MIKITSPSCLPSTDSSGEFESPRYIKFRDLDRIVISSQKLTRRVYSEYSRFTENQIELPIDSRDLDNGNLAFAKRKGSEGMEGLLYIGCYAKGIGYFWLQFDFICRSFFSESRERPVNPLSAVLMSISSNSGKMEFLSGKRLVRNGSLKIVDDLGFHFISNFTLA